MQKACSHVNALGCNIVFTVRVIMSNDFDPAKLQAEVHQRTQRAVEIKRDTEYPPARGHSYMMSFANQEILDTLYATLEEIDADLNRIQETNRLYALLAK